MESIRNVILSLITGTAIIFAATAAHAALYSYSFSNVDGPVNGTVSGNITLADGDGTFAATSVTILSAPVSLGYTLPIEMLSASYPYLLANSFTVSSGQIIDMHFAALNLYDGLFLSDDYSGGGNYLNIRGSGVYDGVIDRDESTLVVTAIPLPAALPLYGAGLALMGLIGWRRKRKT